MPLDIFIPYWGDADYLKETVNSVVAQRNENWVLTVVDDDYPGTVAQEFIEGLRNDRISYMRKPRNEGITANYRTCVRLAQHEVMVILGCDDVLLPNYVDTILQAHARFPDAAIIQPGVQVIDERSVVVRTLADSVKQSIVKPRSRGQQVLSGESLAVSLLHGDWLYWPSLAFRTSKLREVDFRDGFPIIQDLAIVMDMIFKGDQLLLDPTLCFSYRRHSASASSSQLTDGSRFAGEREYFELAARQAHELRWSRAERAAKLRATSRAHAATLLPRALASRNSSAVRALLRHVVGS